MSSAAPPARRPIPAAESAELAKALRQNARLTAELEAIQHADDAEFERLVEIISMLSRFCSAPGLLQCRAPLCCGGSQFVAPCSHSTKANPCDACAQCMIDALELIRLNAWRKTLSFEKRGAVCITKCGAQLSTV